MEQSSMPEHVSVKHRNAASNTNKIWKQKQEGRLGLGCTPEMDRLAAACHKNSSSCILFSAGIFTGDSSDPGRKCAQEDTPIGSFWQRDTQPFPHHVLVLLKLSFASSQLRSSQLNPLPCSQHWHSQHFTFSLASSPWTVVRWCSTSLYSFPDQWAF